MALKKKQSRKDLARVLGEEPKTRPHWKDVLLAVYQGKATANTFGRGWRGISDNHALAKELKISGWELMNSLVFLEEQKLIEYGPEKNWINLTEKGFNVALKIEEQRKTSVYRIGSLYFSAVLTLTLIITLFRQMIGNPGISLMLYVVGIALILILFMKIFVGKPKK